MESRFSQTFALVAGTFVIVCSSLAAGWWLHATFGTSFSTWLNSDLVSPFVPSAVKELPLQKYAIAELAKQTFEASAPLTITEASLAPTDNTATPYTSHLFAYQTQGKTITGILNVPNSPAPTDGYPVIVMLRGYVPLDIYQSGVGTKNAAAKFAEAGFVTIAPDFLGYGSSDPELEDTWEARFIKPVNIADLLATVKAFPNLVTNQETTTQTIPLNPNKIGIWAHSNGGQIALTTLQITGQPLPTSLWAPVTAPFPYSILYFGDELEDEGKEQRAWIAILEKDYDAFDFSLTKHLNLLPPAKIQIHHGTSDDAALIWWSKEFAAKVEAENGRRQDEATLSGKLSQDAETIDLTLYQYPGADHNLQPSWNMVIQRDLQFFGNELLQ